MNRFTGRNKNDLKNNYTKPQTTSLARKLDTAEFQLGIWLEILLGCIDYYYFLSILFICDTVSFRIYFFNADPWRLCLQTRQFTFIIGFLILFRKPFIIISLKLHHNLWSQRDK